jgi:hypothetical protein
MTRSILVNYMHRDHGASTAWLHRGQRDRAPALAHRGKCRSRGERCAVIEVGRGGFYMHLTPGQYAALRRS